MQEAISLAMEPAKTRTGMGDSGTTTQVRWCLQHLSCNAMLNNTATAVATELYPSGGEGFVRKMGNISMTYYTNGFGPDNSYRNISEYRFVKSNEPHPTK